MFFDHRPEFSWFPQAGLLVSAGGLVLVCQLLAMAMVDDRPVRGAGVRDLQQVAQQVALADCIRRSTGPARHGCIHQAQLESKGGGLAVSLPPSALTFTIENIAIAGEGTAGETADRIRVAATR